MLTAVRYEGNTLILRLPVTAATPARTEFATLNQSVATLTPKTADNRVTLEIAATFSMVPVDGGRVTIQLGAAAFERMNVDFSGLTVIDFPEPIKQSIAGQIRQKESGIILPS